MTIQTYRTQPYTTTHENRIFDALLGKLEEVWGNSEDIVILLGNFHCQGSEIDAAVLKKNSITVIDFKDYGGLIEFSENGRWRADGIEIKGGNKPNPFIQIKDNKFALLKVLEKVQFSSGNQPNLGHISGLALFHKPIKFDEKQLPPNIERWFHIVDFDHAVERLSQITSREINLSNQDLERISEALSIPEYVPVGSGTKAGNNVSESKFQNYAPLNPNTAEKKLWECLRKTFQDDPCVAYFRYPIFKRTGNLSREPDVILMHRELGLWVLECKGCSITNIESIEGHQWKTSNWYREEELPVLQAEDGMFAISAKLTERRETRGLVSFHYRVVLPFIKAQEWKDKGFSDLPCTHGVVLLEDDLKPSALREKLQLGSQEYPQRPLSDDQWQNIVALLGGSLPKQEPRAIPTGTSSENPVRVIHDLESRLRFLDDQQQKVAFEVPDGPQRVRGLAGTGKTVLFAKRAAKIHAAHPEWKIAFVFFTRALYAQIIDLIGLYYREMVRQDEGDVEPDWNNVQVLHAWGAKERNGFYRNLAQKSGIRPMSVNDVKQSLGRSCSPSESFEYICNSLEKQVENIPVLFDAILIDEGQDLPPSFYRLAYKSLSDPGRLYWAYDEAQGIGTLTVPRPLQIFGLNPDKTPVVDLGGNKLPDGTITSPTYEGGHRKAHNLNRCYRTPKMLLMAAHTINMGLLRQDGCLQGVSNKGDWEALGYTVLDGDFLDSSVKAGKTVTITREIKNSPHPIDSKDFSQKDALGSPLLIQTFSDESEEQEWVAEQIEKDLKLGFDPWDLMITCPTGDKEQQYFEAMKDKLSRRGIPSIIAGVDTEQDIFRIDKYVTISTIFRAKGNEAWKVYACRFHCATQPIAWKGESELQKRNEAFVALTRARVWCVVTGVDSVSPVFEELRSIVQQYPDVTFKSFNKSSLKRINDEDFV